LVILQAIEHIEIKAKPADLPESLELSIINLATTDDKISVEDIKLPEGVEFADAEQDMELVIANVYEPSALQAANEAAGGEAEAEEESEVPVEGEEAASDTDQSKDEDIGNKGQNESKQPGPEANK
jgi:large subunit ribosomal protein L25